MPAKAYDNHFRSAAATRPRGPYCGVQANLRSLFPTRQRKVIKLFKNVPGRGGFTLLELLLSLTITAVILVIIFGAFRVGIRAWERGERDLEKNQRQRIVLDLLKRQLTSTVVQAGAVASLPGRAPGGTEEADIKLDPYRFEGDSKDLRFASEYPLVPANTFGKVSVRYRVEEDEQNGGERLVLLERNLVFLLAREGEEEEPPAHVLLEGQEEINFQYLASDAQDGEISWVDAWNPEETPGAPGAVRVVLRDVEDQTPLTVIAPIPSLRQEVRRLAAAQ